MLLLLLALNFSKSLPMTQPSAFHRMCSSFSLTYLFWITVNNKINPGCMLHWHCYCVWHLSQGAWFVFPSYDVSIWAVLQCSRQLGNFQPDVSFPPSNLVKNSTTLTSSRVWYECHMTKQIQWQTDIWSLTYKLQSHWFNGICVTQCSLLGLKEKFCHWQTPKII